MSSTRRGSVRSPNDFYATDPKEIVRFMVRWCATDPLAEAFFSQPRKILDPSAGGLTERVEVPQKGDKPPLIFLPSEMPYPQAINQFSKSYHTGRDYHIVDTLDIRENSHAAVKGDFLKMPDETLSDQGYDMIITNPSFLLMLPFIQKSLRIVKPGGYVVMLLPLPFFESKARNKWLLDGNMPVISYVYPNRLSFTPDGKTDSIPYQHCIFQRTGFPLYETKLRILPY